MRTLPRPLFLLALIALPLLAPAQEDGSTLAKEDNEEMTFTEALVANGVNVTTGPATVPLGSIAEIAIPEGFHFIGKDSVERFYELTQNMTNGNEVGVLIAGDWSLYFDYDPIGYVKDDEKDELDADELMETMTANQEAGNRARAERGWSTMRMQGWATRPYYDEATNNLKWAFNISSSDDNFEGVWINESIRLLGRSGVMNVTLVCDTTDFAESERAAEALLARHYTYVDGERYAEFKEGDKIAEYGLAALVLGGAGAVALKTGLLAKLGVFFAKGWKFIVVAAIAAGSFIKRMFNRVTGARPSDDDQA